MKKSNKTGKVYMTTKPNHQDELLKSYSMIFKIIRMIRPNHLGA